jgi:hypothetical protein
VVHVLERSNLDDAGVVDQDIDAPGARDHFVDQTPRFVAIGDVADDGRCVDAAIVKILTRAFELAGVAGGNRDVRALAPQLARDEQS